MHDAGEGEHSEAPVLDLLELQRRQVLLALSAYVSIRQHIDLLELLVYEAF